MSTGGVLSHALIDPICLHPAGHFDAEQVEPALQDAGGANA
jgi:hypothetical protein